MICVTGRDGWAEIEVPFGYIAVAVGRDTMQDGWVGVDQVVAFEFACRRSEVQGVGP
jgi:hypothetical protein